MGDLAAKSVSASVRPRSHVTAAVSWPRGWRSRVFVLLLRKGKRTGKPVVTLRVVETMSGGRLSSCGALIAPIRSARDVITAFKSKKVIYIFTRSKIRLGEWEQDRLNKDDVVR